MDRIVLDTNCLIASLSRRGNYYNVWKSLQDGVSNDKHFSEVSFWDFPPLCVIDLKTFSLMLASIADVKA